MSRSPLSLPEGAALIHAGDPGGTFEGTLGHDLKKKQKKTKTHAGEADKGLSGLLSL